MVKSNLYKGACQLLTMGALEALQFLDVLCKYRPISRRVVAHYVLDSLYAGPELMEGNESYKACEEAVYREVLRARRSPEARGKDNREVLSREAADYLRHILTAAKGGKRVRHLGFKGQYDGFSEDAYKEVRSLLGQYGHRYLGISGTTDSLMPNPYRVRAFAVDTDTAKRKETERVTGPQVLMLDIENGRPPDLFAEIKQALKIPEMEEGTLPGYEDATFRKRKAV